MLSHGCANRFRGGECRCEKTTSSDCFFCCGLYVPFDCTLLAPGAICDGGQSAETLRPLVASVEHKDSSIRTDADYLALATDAWRANNTDDAMRYAYAGLERPASDKRITAALYSSLGVIEVELGLNVQAEQHYRRAIGIDPRFALTHNNLGFLQFNLKGFDEAEASYREAIRLTPDDVEVFTNLGKLLKKTRKNQRVRRDVRPRRRTNTNPEIANLRPSSPTS